MEHLNPEKIVISASRRTDMPAFYMDDFMAQVHRGWFTVVNPYNRKASRVPALPEKVHTIVFWSKDFSRFIDGEYGQVLAAMGYHLFFQFTVNSESRLLEPGVPPLPTRLQQMEILCRDYGPRCINWRFDPICYFKTAPGGPVRDNLKDFETIAVRAGGMGIRRCTTSFMDHYPKIQKRLRSTPGCSFVDPPMEEKISRILDMEKHLGRCGIDLALCCEKDLLSALPSASRVRKSACIPNDLLMELFGGRLSLKKASGQRLGAGCGCMPSVDVGAYHRHPCRHNCLFCYANSAILSGIRPSGERT